jgi:hypothetical protein
LLTKYYNIFFVGWGVSCQVRNDVAKSLTEDNVLPKRVFIDLTIDCEPELRSHIPTPQQITSMKKYIVKKQESVYKYTSADSMREYIMKELVDTQEKYNAKGEVLNIYTKFSINIHIYSYLYLIFYH